MDDNEYRARELAEVGRVELDDKVKVKVVGPDGATKWMSIDVGTYRRLVNVLTSGNN